VNEQSDKEDEEYQQRDHRVNVDSCDRSHVMFDVTHGRYY
jgi:hypothetical protein